MHGTYKCKLNAPISLKPRIAHLQLQHCNTFHSPYSSHQWLSWRIIFLGAEANYLTLPPLCPPGQLVKAGELFSRRQSRELYLQSGMLPGSVLKGQCTLTESHFSIFKLKHSPYIFVELIICNSIIFPGLCTNACCGLGGNKVTFAFPWRLVITGACVMPMKYTA